MCHYLSRSRFKIHHESTWISVVGICRHKSCIRHSMRTDKRVQGTTKKHTTIRGRSIEKRRLLRCCCCCCWRCCYVEGSDYSASFIALRCTRSQCVHCSPRNELNFFARRINRAAIMQRRGALADSWVRVFALAAIASCTCVRVHRVAYRSVCVGRGLFTAHCLH